MTNLLRKVPEKTEMCASEMAEGEGNTLSIAPSQMCVHAGLGVRKQFVVNNNLFSENK